MRSRQPQLTKDCRRAMRYFAGHCPVPLPKALAALRMRRAGFDRLCCLIRMAGRPPYRPDDFADAWVDEGGIVRCRIPAGLEGGASAPA